MKPNRAALLVAISILFAAAPDASAQRDRRGPGGFGGFGGPTGPKIEPEDMKFESGVARIPDRETFEKLSYKGPEVSRDTYLANLEFVKFCVHAPFEKDAQIYFMNTQNHRAHPPWMRTVGISTRVRGAITYLPRIMAPDGTPGLYTIDYQPNDSYTFEQVKFVQDLLTENMPILKGKVSFHPLRGNIAQYERDKAKYEEAGYSVHLDEHLYKRIAYLPLNSAESFGRLRVLENDARPSARDIVICRTLPNQLPRIAGVITEVRQTPLSHVNLRAVQDKVPNAYIHEATKSNEISSLIGKLVHYSVTPDGYSIREATKAEVDKHFADLRPKESQKPERDLSQKEIAALTDLTFKSSSAYGVKAANLAALHGFELPEGTVPDGFAVPFAFYDDFMKHNGFYAEVDKLLADEQFRNDREHQQTQLAALQKRIESGEMPQSMMAALQKVQNKFGEGTSIRCRSSTNNEDLPGFSGAGLYDSFTHNPDEGHLASSIRQVYASLWNFRAFDERDFYRIDHKVAAMGVVLHPNFKGEKANGVAVTEDILYESQGNYYVNTQPGEDLVTNPDASSSPEELLLGWWERDGHEVVRRSAQAPEGKQLLAEPHLGNLRKHLGRIHARFSTLYGRDREDLTFAMEIEFKITSDNKLVIKQARPWVF